MCIRDRVIAVLTMLIDHLCKIVLQWLLSNYWGAMADNGQMSWERFREIDYFIPVSYTHLLEVLLCKIYEDNILGKLSDSRYATLDAQ